ncbi:unnamed protein product [Ceratitis capitata]|uniref:(Mediterranean fruit fly) hypothetical protein n=1 Tax=Ceratitis capitata TaxID=7213 RepID=A0A811V6Q3_CERCA|nr:unnamed protein product [Ceratitis capitata]
MPSMCLPPNVVREVLQRECSKKKAEKIKNSSTKVQDPFNEYKQKANDLQAITITNTTNHHHYTQSAPPKKAINPTAYIHTRTLKFSYFIILHMHGVLLVMFACLLVATNRSMTSLQSIFSNC